MILAAGLGTRMAPLTETYAKTALPVLDEPLVLRLARSLADQGVEHLIVNAHAHPEQVREALAKSPIPAQISYEPELLGSGGGIRQARALLDGTEPFFVLNSDMCIDLDLDALLQAHAAAGAAATLVLRDEPRKHEFGTIGYASGARVCRITNLARHGAEVGSGLFAGVQVIEPELFEQMPDVGTFESMVDLYAPMLRRGEPIGVWLQPLDATWWPVGSPRELLDANLSALSQLGAEPRVAEDASVEGRLLAPVWVGAGARIAAGATAGPDAVIGAGATLGANATASHSLLLPAARVAPGTGLHHAIAWDDEVWTDA